MSKAVGTYKMVGDPKDATKPCAVIAFLLQENKLAVAASGFNPAGSYEFDFDKGKKMAMDRAKIALQNLNEGKDNIRNLATAIEYEAKDLPNYLSKTRVVDDKGSLFLSFD